MLITLEEIKYHLRLDPEPDEEQDPQLIAMYESAINYCENYMDRTIPFEGEDTINPSVRAAVLLIIGDLFEHREQTVVGAITARIPTALNLLHFHRKGLGI